VKISIVAAAAAVFVGATVGFAGPALAGGPAFDGKFLSVTEDGQTSTWVVTPCGDACAHVVSDTGNVDLDAHLVNGQWTFTYVHPTGWDCEDGTYAPATWHVSVDASTLQGTVDQGPDSVCGKVDVVDDPFHFSLSQIG